MFLKFQKNMRWSYVCFCHLHAANDSEWGWKRAPRFKCCPLALGSLPYTTASGTGLNAKECSPCLSENFIHASFCPSTINVSNYFLLLCKCGGLVLSGQVKSDNEGAPSCGEEVPQVPYPRPPVPPHISHFLIKYVKADPCSTLDNPSSK